ncbi:hypothetical protein [Streptomyces spiramyceticus]|uniref:hypothetical protein n=1 Tax=Streptomyces spiramyceticus TaxID=299717 RepID=UPI00237BBBE4|nr:hypothetical protein [Streptomyces spiramyceticus]
MEAASSALPLRRLMGACELSEYQTCSGLTAMRDLCGERGWPPLIWTRADGYHFCASEEELEEWERIWTGRSSPPSGGMITGTLAPHLALLSFEPVSELPEHADQSGRGQLGDGGLEDPDSGTRTTTGRTGFWPAPPTSRPGPTLAMRRRRCPSDMTDAEWALLEPRGRSWLRLMAVTIEAAF